MPERQPILSPEQLAELRRFSSPTLCNAIEVFDICPRSAGFMGPEIRSQLPMAEPVVGYAATATIRAAQKPEKQASRADYWRAILEVPAPRIVVLQDLDNPPAVGSFWGEVNVTVHKALGCIGTITNGGVRDLDEVERLGFGYLASATIVSHAYVHIVDYAVPVEVGGLTIRPGDLLFADRHGALLIPPEVAPYLADMAARFEAVEQEFLAKVRRPGLTVERLAADWAEFDRARAALKPKA